MPKLPLFPLNTVLFPGTSLSLHIFEERYKLMIGRCIEANQPFGVVLIKSGAEVLGMGSTAETYPVGCVARIVQSQTVGAGHMNITTIGVERFQILTVQRDLPYLSAEVEPYPLKIGSLEAVRRAARKLRPWVARYIETLQETEKLQPDLRRLPQDSLALAYHAAALLKISLTEKQYLLTVADAAEMVEHVGSLYRKEVALIRTMLQPQHDQGGPFSLN